MSCGVGRRSSSEPALLWLWYRPVATAPIQTLAWEHPYAEGVALKRKKKKEGLIPFQSRSSSSCTHIWSLGHCMTLAQGF